MSERFILCKGERLAYQTISQITNRYDAQVFPHLRIKEVASQNWIKEEDFDYALKGHVDFTIAKDFKTVLALELDGKFHQSEKARERDRKKDLICESLGIPLVRLDSGSMRLDLLQPVIAELVEIWLSNADMRALEFAHLHFLSANWMQLEETANYNRDTLEIAEDAEWFLQMTCVSSEEGYSDACLELVFPQHRVAIGHGRSKVPTRSKVCGRFLAERIAAADAGAYIRTIAGTMRDTTSETKLPVESACDACAARLATFTPPQVELARGGTKSVGIRRVIRLPADAPEARPGGGKLPAEVSSTLDARAGSGATPPAGAVPRRVPCRLPSELPRGPEHR